MKKLDLKIFPYGLPDPEAFLSDKKVNASLSEMDPPKGLSYLLGLLELFQSNDKSGIIQEIYPLTLLSSVSGKIKEIAFHYSNINDNKNNCPVPQEMIGNLMQTMSDVVFYIVVNKFVDIPDSTKTYLDGVKGNNTLHFVPIASGEEFSFWASDTYITAHSHNGSEDYLIEPHLLMDRTNKADSNIFFEHFDKYGIEFIPNFKLDSIGLSFAGGNILVGDDFILMGKNIESFNSRGGANEKDLAEIIPFVVDYIVDKKINLRDIMSSVIPLFNKSQISQDLIEQKLASLNKNHAPFSKEWAEVLKNSTSLKEVIKLLIKQDFAVEKLFQYFLGGNSKEGKQRKIYFVGQHILDNNEFFLNENETHCSAIHKKKQGTDLKQPFYHLDLFISLAGERRLVVGEPVIGLPDEVLGYIDLETLGLIHHQVHRMRHYINQAIEDLSSSNFEIHRIPMPLTYYNYLDGKGNLKFAWFWAAYNNCLVEIDREGNKNVWIPSFSKNIYPRSNPSIVFPSEWQKAWKDYYKDEMISRNSLKYAEWSELQPHQEQVEKTWKDLGFHVEFIQGNFNWYMQYSGSLKCFSNCIKRI